MFLCTRVQGHVAKDFHPSWDLSRGLLDYCGSGPRFTGTALFLGLPLFMYLVVSLRHKKETNMDLSRWRYCALLLLFPNLLYIGQSLWEAPGRQMHVYLLYSFQHISFSHSLANQPNIKSSRQNVRHANADIYLNKKNHNTSPQK
jgi:hypothetical protein